MCKFIFNFLFIFGTFSTALAGHGIPPPTDTTCSDGTKQRGTFQFDVYSGSIQFCDGNEWQSLDASIYVNDSCTTPGAQRFNAAQMQYCDGTNWHGMDAGMTSTTCAVAGAQISTRYSVAVYCDGSFWHGMSPVIAPSSLACNDFVSRRHCLNAAGCSWNAGYCYADSDCATRYDINMCNANPQCQWAAGMCGTAY